MAAEGEAVMIQIGLILGAAFSFAFAAAMFLRLIIGYASALSKNGAVVRVPSGTVYWILAQVAIGATAGVVFTIFATGGALR